MTYQPNHSEQSFLPTTLILPPTANESDFNQVLTDNMKKMIAGINQKEIAQYREEEVLNGQQFFTNQNNQELRNVYRKVINCGTLPNNSTLSVAHKIDVTPTTIFTRIYGCSSSPTSRFIPIPYIDSAYGNVELYVDANAVQLTTTSANFNVFTTTYVVLEYIKG